MVDPTNVFAMDDIKFMTGFNIERWWPRELDPGRHRKAYGTTSQEDLEQVHAVDERDGEPDVELQSEETEMDLADLEKAR